METPPKKPGLSVLRRLAEFIRPYRGLFWLSLALTILMAVFNPMRVMMIDHMLGFVQQKDFSQLRLWVALSLGVLVVQTIVSYYQTWFTNLMGQNVMSDLRQRVFEHLMRLRMRYFDRHAVGALQTRTISDIETLTNLFSQGFVSIFSQLLELVFIAIAMFLMDWRLALTVLLISPLLIIASRVFQLKVRAAFNRVRDAVRALNAFIQEHIQGMSVTQIFNREEAEFGKFHEINRQHRKAHLQTVLYYSIFFPVIELVASIWLAVMVVYGSWLSLNGSVQPGELIAFILFSGMFFRPIRMLAERFNELQYGIVSGGRIFEVLDTEEFIADTGSHINDKALTSKLLSVEYDHVSFAYNESPEPDAEPDWVLRDVSFRVEPGTTTALVGATGSGKSTIISTLMRFYEPQQGEIRINDLPLGEYTLNGLRGALCLVQQDVFMFNGSIHDNITLLNPEISRERVVAAARAVGAHDFIVRLPEGYDFKVGERGNALSTGQRQLIAFVRVMVYDPSILLLDEATANVDTETELAVQTAIATVLKGRTAIIIAHRLSTIQKADQILVLKKGQIIERGSHQELLAMGGHYKNLYLLQYGSQLMANGKTS